MGTQLPWEYAEEELDRMQLLAMATDVQLLLPVERLQEAEPGEFVLTPDELLFLVWAIRDLAIGRVAHALFSFERRLLPMAPEKGRRWHACVLLWCALCRLYICDPSGALEHIAVAESAGLAEEPVPEMGLAKGMALRLAGRPRDAVVSLRLVARRDSALYPACRHQAMAWLLESLAVYRPCAATSLQMRWLERKSRSSYLGTMGVLPAALYRLCAQHEQRGECEHDLDSIMHLLDIAPIFERPLLTMLLADILPRPLAGVESGTRALESYWW